MKPGYQSTDFWLSLLAILAGHTLASQAITDSHALQIVGFGSQFLGSAGYTWARSALKINAIDGSDLKSGWKSSEFWLSALSSILGLTTASGFITSEVITRILALIQTNIIGVIYLWQRSRVKKAHIVDAKERRAMEGQSIRTVVQ